MGTAGSFAATAPDETARFLCELADRGIRLWLEDGRLLCSVPAEALDEGLRARLKAERPALVALLSREEPAPAGLVPLPADAARPLTLAQEALLPLARARSGESVYNVPFAVEIEGPVDRRLFGTAIIALQSRHDALRTCFPAASAGPVLRPRGAWVGLDVALPLPARGIDDPARQAVVDAAFRDAVARPFDLENGPLWRYLMAIGTDRTIVLFVFHHLVFDGFSRDIVLAELDASFATALAGGTPDRKAAPLQPTDFAAWERERAAGPQAEAARAWWRARFARHHPAAALPPAPAEETEAGSLRVAIPAATAAALRARAAAAHLPPAALALAASALTLHRTTGQRRILACTPLANRDRPEVAGIVGYLNRLLPLSVDLGAPGGSGAALAAGVARDLFAADAHRHLPTGEIVGLPGLARTRIDRFMVAWQERNTPLRLGPHPAAPFAVARAGADFGLALQFEADGEGLACRIDRAADVLGPAGAAAFARRLCETLDALVGAGWDAAASLPAADPESVAALLAAHPGVGEAAALADPETGLTTVFLVLDEFERASAPALRAWAAERIGGPLPPLRLATLPALPRTASGAVDRAALAERTGAPERTAFAAPRTELERIVAEIWQRVLWLDRPVGIDEDFRELGGHSLLCVRMLADLQAALGRPLAPHRLLRLGTVAELAAAVETAQDVAAPAEPAPGLDPEILGRLRAYTASWSGWRHAADALIVGLNREGTRIPLFWCLQNETEFSQLARYIGADQPVFGMRSGHEAMVKTRENIARLAAHYAREIQAVQPRGALFLGGNCQAAVIAFEAARQLAAAGRTVGLVILHEKMIAEPWAGRVALTFGRDSTRNPYLASDDPLSEFRAFYTGPVSLDLVMGTHSRFFQEPNVLDLVATIRRRRDETPELVPGPGNDHASVTDGNGRVDDLV